MPMWKKRLFARLQDQADDGAGGSSAGGSGDGQTGEQGGQGGADGGADGGNKSGEGAKGPSDEEARLLRENMRKKEELARLNGELAKAKKALSKLDELGGLDTIAAMVAERKANEQKSLEAKGEWDKLKASMAAEHAKELQAREKTLEDVRKANEALAAQINELTIGSAFSNSQFVTKDTVLTPAKARAIYGQHFDLVDGKVVGFDKPRGAAGRTPLVDASGEPVPFEAAMKRLVEADPDKEALLRAHIRPGAGSGSKGTPAGGTPSNKQGAAAADSLSRISAGLKSLNIDLNAGRMGG